MQKTFLSCLLLVSMAGHTQNKAWYGTLTAAVGNNEGSGSLEVLHNWSIGKSHNIDVGVGARFTSYFGRSRYFSSAPANLASDESKSDSLLLTDAQVNALNVMINLGYRIFPKFSVGFSIDAVGFSFGSNQSGSYLNGIFGQSTSAKPTSFNALLIGNNDIGTLNSQFYVHYVLNESLYLRASFQYLFAEYTTDTQVQQEPEPNDRFRHKAPMVSIGITKKL
jgi:hypothetical protein